MAVDRLPDEEAIYVTLAEMKEVSRRFYQAVGNLPGRNLQPSYSSSPRTPPHGMQFVITCPGQRCTVGTHPARS